MTDETSEFTPDFGPEWVVKPIGMPPRLIPCVSHKPEHPGTVEIHFNFALTDEQRWSILEHMKGWPIPGGDHDDPDHKFTAATRAVARGAA